MKNFSILIIFLVFTSGLFLFSEDNYIMNYNHPHRDVNNIKVFLRGSNLYEIEGTWAPLVFYKDTVDLKYLLDGDPDDADLKVIMTKININGVKTDTIHYNFYTEDTPINSFTIGIPFTYMPSSSSQPIIWSDYEIHANTKIGTSQFFWATKWLIKDESAPSVTITPTYPSTTYNGWYKGIITLTGSASDSGVKYFKSGVNNNSWQYKDGSNIYRNSDNSVSFGNSGSRTIYFRVADNVGNYGYQSKLIKIDNVAPHNINFNSIFVEYLTNEQNKINNVNLSCSETIDENVGIVNYDIEITIDGQTEVFRSDTPSWTFPLTPHGEGDNTLQRDTEYSIRVRAVDILGNATYWTNYYSFTTPPIYLEIDDDDEKNIKYDNPFVSEENGIKKINYFCTFYFKLPAIYSGQNFDWSWQYYREKINTMKIRIDRMEDDKSSFYPSDLINIEDCTTDPLFRYNFNLPEYAHKRYYYVPIMDHLDTVSVSEIGKKYPSSGTPDIIPNYPAPFKLIFSYDNNLIADIERDKVLVNESGDSLNTDTLLINTEQAEKLNLSLSNDCSHDIENDILKFKFSYKNITIDESGDYVNPGDINISDFTTLLNLNEFSVINTSRKWECSIDVAEYMKNDEDEEIQLNEIYTGADKEFLGYGEDKSGDYNDYQTTGSFDIHFDLDRPRGNFYVISPDEDRKLDMDKSINKKTVRLYFNEYNNKGNNEGIIHDFPGYVDSGIKSVYCWNIDNSADTDAIESKYNEINTQLIIIMNVGIGKNDFENITLPSITDEYENQFIMDCFELNNDLYKLKPGLSDEEKNEILNILMEVYSGEFNKILEDVFNNAGNSTDLNLNLGPGKSFPYEGCPDDFNIDVSTWEYRYFPEKLSKYTFNEILDRITEENIDDTNVIIDSYEAAGDYYNLKDSADKAAVTVILKKLGFISWRVGDEGSEHSYGAFREWNLSDGSGDKYIGMRFADGAGNCYYRYKVINVDTILPETPSLDTFSHVYEDNTMDVTWASPEDEDRNKLLYNVSYKSENNINSINIAPVIWMKDGIPTATIKIPLDNTEPNTPIWITIRTVDPAGNESENYIKYLIYTPSEVGNLVVSEIEPVSPVQGYNTVNEYHYVEWLSEGGRYEEQYLEVKLDTDETADFTDFSTELFNGIFIHKDLRVKTLYNYRLAAYNKRAEILLLDNNNLELDKRELGNHKTVSNEIQKFILKNNPPLAPGSLKPDNYANKDAVFSWSPSIDYDKDDIIYNIYINNRLEATTDNTVIQAKDLSINFIHGQEYSWSVQAVDSSGVTSDMVYQAFRCDNNAPAINILDEPVDGLYTNQKELNIELTDDLSGISSFCYQFVGQDLSGDLTGDMEQKQLNAKITLIPGFYEIDMKALDYAGNTGYPEKTDGSQYYPHLRVDHSIPEIKGEIIIGDGNSPVYYCSKDVNVAVSFFDEFSGIHGFNYCFKDSNGEIKQEGFIEIENSPSDSRITGTEYSVDFEGMIELFGIDGEEYSLEIKPVDWAGNIGNINNEKFSGTKIIYDSSPPEIDKLTLSSPYPGMYIYLRNIKDLSVDFTFDDPHSGVKGYYGIIENGSEEEPEWFSSWEDIQNNAGLNLDEGKGYRVKVKAVNGAGDKDTRASSVFVLDESNPDIVEVIKDAEDILVPDDLVKITVNVNEEQSEIVQYRLAVMDENGDKDFSSLFPVNTDGWLTSESNELQFSVPSIGDGIYHVVVEVENAVGYKASYNELTLEVKNNIERMGVEDYKDFTADNTKLEVNLNYNGDNTPDYYEYMITTKDLQISSWMKSESEYVAITSIIKQDGTEEPLSLLNNTEYFVKARAVFDDGSNLFEGISDGVTVDLTPPEFVGKNGFETPFASTSSGIYVDWDTTDDISGINKVELIYELLQPDNNGKMISLYKNIIQLKNSYKENNVPVVLKDDEGASINLLTGMRVKLILKVTNGAGAPVESDSFEIIIDNSKPPAPFVVDQGDVLNINYLPEFHWIWSKNDPESTIVQYKWTILNEPIITDATEWYELNENDVDKTVSIKDYPGIDFIPVHGEKIYFAVKALNGAGLENTGFSNGIIYDETAPVVARVKLLNTGDSTDDAEVNYISTTEGLRLFIEAVDDVSIIDNYSATYGMWDKNKNYIQADDTVYNSENYLLNLDDTKTPVMTPGDIYTFKGECWNADVQLVGSGYSTGVVLDNELPVIEYVDGYVKEYVEDFTGYKLLHFKWAGIENYAPIKEYIISLYKKNEDNGNFEKLWDKEAGLMTEYSIENLTDGIYKLRVVAANVVNVKSVDVFSSPVLFDITPPDIKEYKYPGYVSSIINIYVEAQDILSGITEYQYAVGTIEDPFAVTGDWIGEFSSEGIFNKNIYFDDFPAGYDGIMDGAKIFVTIRIRNGAGLWTSDFKSDPIILDKSPPSIPDVNSNKYTIDDNIIRDVKIFSEDKQSGITAYKTSIVPDKDEDTLNNAVWNEFNIGNPGEFIDKLDMTDDVQCELLIHGYKYYVAVKTKNGAGMWSPQAGFSDEVTADLNPPVISFGTGEEIVVNDIGRDGFPIEYEVIEDISEPVKITFRLVSPGGQLFEYDTVSMMNGFHDFIFTHTEYGIYELKADCEDDAGNISSFVQLIRVNEPPEISLQEFITNPAKPFMLSALVVDPDGDNDHFSYKWIIEDQDHDSNNPLVVFTDVAEYMHKFKHSSGDPFAPITEYNLTLVVTDSKGKSNTALSKVIVKNTSSGTLYMDEYWSYTDDESLMHDVYGDITVPEGITLTMLAYKDKEVNVKVKVTGNEELGYDHRIIIEGKLVFQSNTSIFMDEDLNTTWSGIYITGEAEFDGVEIRDAKRAVTVLDDAAVNINNCTFIKNEIGIHVFNNSPVITNSRFIDQIIYGIKEDSGAKPAVINCSFKNNRFDYYHQDITVMKADEINQFDGNTGNINEDEE